MKVWRFGIFCAMLLLLAGCKSLGLGNKRIDYGAGATQVPALEIPPDLTVPASDERYRVPQGEGESVATFSDYSRGSGGSAAGQPDSDARREGAVALRQLSDGSRVVVVGDTFDRAWRRIGLAIERAGLRVEDRDRTKGIYFLRPPKTEEGWLDKMQFWKDNQDTGKRYSVNVRDGGVACEVSVTDQNGATDEAGMQMLEAIYRNVGQDSTSTAAPTVTSINASGPAGTATLEEIFDGSHVIVVNDAFDRSWHKVGKAVERAGLIVEETDRASGIYFLKPAKREKTLLGTLEFWRDDTPTVRYRVNVKDGGKACEISVTDQDGSSDEATGKMIEAIYKNLNL